MYIYTESHKIWSTQSICVHPGAQNSEDKEVLCFCPELVTSSLSECAHTSVLLKGWWQRIKPIISKIFGEFHRLTSHPANNTNLKCEDYYPLIFWVILSVSVCRHKHHTHIYIYGSWEQSLDASVGRISIALDAIGFSPT